MPSTRFQSKPVKNFGALHVHLQHSSCTITSIWHSRWPNLHHSISPPLSVLHQRQPFQFLVWITKRTYDVQRIYGPATQTTLNPQIHCRKMPNSWKVSISGVLPGLSRIVLCPLVIANEVLTRKGLHGMCEQSL